MVELVELTKRFGHVTAVHELSLSVRTGEFLTLLGPSGCGKTTTLRMVAGFEQPTSGRILIDDVAMDGQPPYKRPVNTVFQQYALFPHLTVYENIAFGLKVKKVPVSDRASRIGDMLDMLSLVGLEHRKPGEISGGQQQRVALARALVCRPKVLLLDEPLGALDLKLRQQIQLEIKQLQRELGITFIYVTHDQDEALALSDRMVIMKDGHIEQIGTPRDVYGAPATRFVANFVGETNMLEGTVVASQGGLAAIEWRGMTVTGRRPVHPVNPGTRAAMVLRPEHIQLKRLDKGHRADAAIGRSSGNGVTTAIAPDTVGVVGTVIEEVYGGSHVRVVVQLDDGSKLFVRTEEEDAGLYPIGVTVRASWAESMPILVGCD